MMLSLTSGISSRGNLSKTLESESGTIDFTMEDLHLVPGQIAAIIGRNGSGKTTILRLLCGVLLPDGGTSHCARPMIAFTDIERQMNHRLTVMEGFTFTRALFAQPRIGRSVMMQVLANLGLGVAAGQRIGTLSKGQKTRLALAIIASAPWASILLDEPTSGLDADGERLVRTVLTEAAGQGAAIIFTSHDAALVHGIAHVIIARDADGIFRAVPADGLRLSHRLQLRLVDGAILDIAENDLAPTLARLAGTITGIERLGLDHES